MVYFIPIIDMTNWNEKSRHDVKLNRRRNDIHFRNNKYNDLEEYAMCKYKSGDLFLPNLRQIFARKRPFFYFWGVDPPSHVSINEIYTALGNCSLVT